MTAVLLVFLGALALYLGKRWSNASAELRARIAAVKRQRARRAR